MVCGLCEYLLKLGGVQQGRADRNVRLVIKHLESFIQCGEQNSQKGAKSRLEAHDIQSTPGKDDVLQPGNAKV
jgi:hypothetical protein